MSVRKYRSVEEMPGVRPRTPLHPENLRIACELTELAYGLHPWRFEPGVRKFRSIEEANRHREERERRQVRRGRGTVEGSGSTTPVDLKPPADLPFLASISWFDHDYRSLDPLDMLRRYESGWRHLHVLGEPSPEEWDFIRRLVDRFGSVLDVPA